MLLRISAVLWRITIRVGQMAARREKNNASSRGEKIDTGVSLGIIKPDTIKY